MRLRIRLTGGEATIRIELPDQSSLEDLRAALTTSEKLELSCAHSSAVKLSLNKKDLLEAPASTSLKSLGLSHGDLLWVLHSAANYRQHSSAVPAAATQSENTAGTGSPVTGGSQPSLPSLATDSCTPSALEPTAIDGVPQLSTWDSGLPESGPTDPMQHNDATTEDRADQGRQPDYLSRLLRSGPSPGTAAEALVLLVHAAFLEGGLQLRQQDGMGLRSRWRLSSGLSALLYTLVPAGEHLGSCCTLQFTVLGDYLIIAAAAGQNAIHQLVLSIAGCASLSSKQGTAGVQYPSQQQTWAQVKDSLVLPVKTALCRAGGRALPLSLLLLPSELRDRCLQQLVPADLAKVSCVCLELRQAASANHLWQPHLGQLSPSHAQAQQGSAQAAACCKSIYGRLIAQQQREQAARERAYQRFQPSHNPFSGSRPMLVQPPPPGFPPGVIGGDYDRLPFLPGMDGSGLSSRTFGGLGSGASASAGLFGTGRLRGSGSWRLH